LIAFIVCVWFSEFPDSAVLVVSDRLHIIQSSDQKTKRESSEEIQELELGTHVERALSQILNPTSRTDVDRTDQQLQLVLENTTATCFKGVPLVGDRCSFYLMMPEAMKSGKDTQFKFKKNKNSPLTEESVCVLYI